MQPPFLIMQVADPEVIEATLFVNLAQVSTIRALADDDPVYSDEQGDAGVELTLSDGRSFIPLNLHFTQVWNLLRDSVGMLPEEPTA